MGESSRDLQDGVTAYAQQKCRHAVLTKIGLLDEGHSADTLNITNDARSEQPSANQAEKDVARVRDDLEGQDVPIENG